MPMMTAMLASGPEVYLVAQSVPTVSFTSAPTFAVTPCRTDWTHQAEVDQEETDEHHIEDVARYGLANTKNR